MSHGFFPCFSSYKHQECPLSEIFNSPSDVRRVKDLLSGMIDCKTQVDIKQAIGGKEIKPIRPDSKENKRVIKIVGDSSGVTLLKIDYGNNPFRVYLGIAVDRTIKIYMIDTKHRFY